MLIKVTKEIPIRLVRPRDPRDPTNPTKTKTF